MTPVLIKTLLLTLLLPGSGSAGGAQLQTGSNHSAAAAANPPAPNYLETGRQITGILDRFMSLGYDKRVRPNYGGPPVEVNVTMRILSISSVSEVMMDFTADFYFRQTWHDPRLSFKKLGDIQTLYVGAEVSKKIWLPDTFFGNEKLAYFHEATTPNVFLRIDHSGEVYRSIRLTVTSSCPMNLQYFPMDKQRCTIEAESYGYNVKDIIYRWARKETAVERDKEISLPQFDIVRTVQKYRLEELSSGTYSRLIAEIHFARRMGYYLIQIYIPSSLIVVISWVSFWLHRNASPARVQLGVTTVLTMTTLMSSTNAALPKISYVKSIDIFLGTCFIMVFAALLEYATVGYLGKRIAMRKAHVQHAQSQANARLFAQLQAQGAQGDPVPPTTTAALLADLAGPADPSNQAFQQQQQQHSSPLLRQVAQQAVLLQQQQQQQQQLQSLGLELAQGPMAPERTSSHHHCAHQSFTGPNQAPRHEPCQHATSHRCCCPADHQNVAGRKQRQQQTSEVCQHCRAGRAAAIQPAAAAAASRTLPRNFLSYDHCHQHNNPNYLLMSPAAIEAQALEKSMHEATGGASFGFSPLFATTGGSPASPVGGNGLNLPPAYAGKPGNAAAAAAAAAATFVNLHRKQKGLPPSTNPNFNQQFSWSGQHERGMETIFGIRPSDIDKYSRVVFPVCFVCFQLMYWIVYLHISAFLETEQQQNQLPA